MDNKWITISSNFRPKRKKQNNNYNILIIMMCINIINKKKPYVKKWITISSISSRPVNGQKKMSDFFGKFFQ